MIQLAREYRCTREVTGCPKEQRQGHYVICDSETEARNMMSIRYPGETFTIDFWKMKRLW